MKKILFIAALATLPLAASASAVSDVFAGQDVILRAVGGTISATINGATTTVPLPPTALGKLAKAAGSPNTAMDLFNLVPALGLHTTVTFTGTEPTANVVRWGISDTPIIGTTVNVVFGGTTYALKVNTFDGRIYQA